MLGLEINVVLRTAIYLNRSWCLVLLVHVDIQTNVLSIFYYIVVKFNLLRNNMLIELNMLDMGGLPVNIDILLLGNDNLSVEINTFIVSCVQNYIKDTRRFS
jgi:hypothetical protein